MKRECSAVGKTQRALCSWLIRRRRWSQAVSRRSSSATSSSGRPAGADSSGREPLGQLDVAVDRVADEVDRARTGGAATSTSRQPDAQLADHGPTFPARSSGTNPQPVPVPASAVRGPSRGGRQGVADRDPGAAILPKLDREVAQPGRVRLQGNVRAAPRPADVVAQGAWLRSRWHAAPVRSGDSVSTTEDIEESGTGPIGEADAEVVVPRAHQQGPMIRARHPHSEDRATGDPLACRRRSR